MRYYLVLLLLIIGTAANAATATLLPHTYGGGGHTAKDTDTVLRKRSISAGINYGSDVLFFGRTGPVTYPYMSTDVIYNTKNGFFIYGSAVKVLGYDPFFDEIDLGAGYLFNYTKKATGVISYTRFFFNRDAADVIKSASSNDLNFKNTFDWKVFKTSVTADYLFGKESDFFLTFNASKYFESSWSVFDDNDFISINPGISAIFGTQNFVGKFSRDHLNRFELYAIGAPPVEGSTARPYNNGRFNALNYSIKLPIAYNRPHYTFEASAKYSIPVNVEGGLKNRHELFYNLTFYYVFY